MLTERRVPKDGLLSIIANNRSGGGGRGGGGGGANCAALICKPPINLRQPKSEANEII